MLPIFLQNLHGLTANQTGLVILPGAIASAVTMAFVGKNANRLDARATVAIGAVMFFVAMWMLSRMTLASGPEETFWPLILRGVGLGLIFVPLTSATMAEMKDHELAQGTGMFNLTRQLGGSLGIAIMATLLTRFTAQKKARLTEHVTNIDPTSLGRLEQITRGLIARGINPIVAKQQALFVLDRQIGAQASVLAFSRIYILSGSHSARRRSAAVPVQDRKGARVGGDGALNRAGNGERRTTKTRRRAAIWSCASRRAHRSLRHAARQRRSRSGTPLAVRYGRTYPRPRALTGQLVSTLSPLTPAMTSFKCTTMHTWFGMTRTFSPTVGAPRRVREIENAVLLGHPLHDHLAVVRSRIRIPRPRRLASARGRAPCCPRR